jgi:c-di-GMP-binding flagellar brake protein YcgR
MEKFGLNELEINKEIQFINNKTFYEGAIVKLYEKCMGVQIPTEQPNFKIINENQSVDFLVVYDDAAYWCKSKVLGCKAEDKGQLVLLDQPEIINRIERRQYKRLQALMDAEYLLLPDGVNSIHDISPILFRQMKKTFTLDISGGGVAIVTYQKIEEGKSVLTSFVLDERMAILCEVVRSEKNEKNDNYKTALKFKDIDEERRQDIIDYVNARFVNHK